MEFGFTGTVGHTAPEVGDPDVPQNYSYHMVPADLWAAGSILTYLVRYSENGESAELHLLRDIADKMRHLAFLRLGAGDALVLFRNMYISH